AAVARRDLLEVGARGEHRPGPGEHEDPHGLVGLSPVERLLHARGDGTVDGVAGLGSVDGQQGDVALHLVVDHGRHPSPRYSRATGLLDPMSAGGRRRRRPVPHAPGRTACTRSRPSCSTWTAPSLTPTGPSTTPSGRAASPTRTSPTGTCSPTSAHGSASPSRPTWTPTTPRRSWPSPASRRSWPPSTCPGRSAPTSTAGWGRSSWPRSGGRPTSRSSPTRSTDR